MHVYVPDPPGGTRRPAAHAWRSCGRRSSATTSSRCTCSRRSTWRTAGVVGAEALVRWHHPTRGLLSPAELLPAAEQAGLLRPLADAVLELSLDGGRPLVAAPRRAGVGQPVRGQRHRPRPARQGGPGAAAPRPARAGAHPGAGRGHPDGRSRAGADGAGRAAPARRPDVDRRLRHRLQLAGLPAAPARPTSSSSTAASPTTSARTPARPRS